MSRLNECRRLRDGRLDLGYVDARHRHRLLQEHGAVVLERQQRRLEMVLARRYDGHAVQIALSEKALGVGIPAFDAPTSRDFLRAGWITIGDPDDRYVRLSRVRAQVPLAEVADADDSDTQRSSHTPAPRSVLGASSTVRPRG